MKDLDKELRELLADDPLGLLDVKPKVSSVVSADSRLVASFAEITAYVEQHGSEPTKSKDMAERKLYSRLKGLRESPDKIEMLREFDSCGLFGDVVVAEVKPIETAQDILDSDPLGLLDDDEDDVRSIFKLVNVPEQKAKPDHVALRKPCEEFERFEPIFKTCHAGLKAAAKVTVPFRTEKQIKPGSVFVLQGILVYVANQGDSVRKGKGRGRVNSRLWCIFENGTESNMLLRSLSTMLWADRANREVVDSSQLELLAADKERCSDGSSTGFIYVLRSLSKDPAIAGKRDLYKIGFSSQPVEERIKTAKTDPTFLMADVEPVGIYETYDLYPQKLELLLHRFFAKVCVNFDVNDSEGNRHSPREWFMVPLDTINVAIDLMLNGEAANYRYDAELRQIVSKEI